MRGEQLELDQDGTGVTLGSSNPGLLVSMCDKLRENDLLYFVNENKLEHEACRSFYVFNNFSLENFEYLSLRTASLKSKNLA